MTGGCAAIIMFAYYHAVVVPREIDAPGSVANQKLNLWRSHVFYKASLLSLLALSLSLTVQAQVPLNQISTDPFMSPIGGQHSTEVEAATNSNGSTIVSIFQEGRFYSNGGSVDNGYATSTNSGATWTTGSLPGITVNGGGGGIYDRCSDPSVVYDAAHRIWLAESLPLYANLGATSPMLVSRATDGIHWGTPVTVGPVYNRPDKTWLTCDNSTISPYYGTCYAEWDDNSAGDIIYFSTSNDGGQTWSSPVQPSGGPAMFGANALTQPNGFVIAAAADAFDLNIQATTSADGGKTFTSPVTVSVITKHTPGGGVRTLVLPSGAIDANGKYFVFWADCSFRAGCTSNDIVYSTSTNGVTWSKLNRVPIDKLTSPSDHFLPGVTIEAGTGGSSAHIGLMYYYYANGNCLANCKLQAGYISSLNGGSTWSAPTVLTPTMNLPWLASTTLGKMVTDFGAVTFSNGKAFPMVAYATAKVGTAWHESMNTVVTGLVDKPGTLSAGHDFRFPNAVSDSPAPTRPVCDSCEDKD